MKKKGLLGAIVIALLCTGCVHKLNAVTTKAENNFQLPDVKSEISQEKCCICGNNERSLMPYYRKSGMLGLVCLNTMEISTLDTRVYSDDGTEIISDGGLSITSVNTDQTEHTARRFSAWLPPIQCTLSGHQCMMLIQV